MILLSPVLIKKYMPAMSLAAVDFGSMFLTVGRLGVGFMTYKLLNNWRNFMANTYCDIGLNDCILPSINLGETQLQRSISKALEVVTTMGFVWIGTASRTGLL